MQGDYKVVETPLQRRRVITGSWVFAGRLLSPKPAGVAAGAAGNFRFGAPPACRNFCLRQARLGCNLARNAVVPSSATFCVRNVLPLENPESTGGTPYLPAHNSFAFFRRKRRIRAQHVSQGRVHFYLRRLRFRPHALLVVSVGKFNTRRRRNALFARGLMRLFPAISARKGADERKVGFFSKHRNAAEVHAELSGTARSGTGYPWISLRACSNRRKFLSPQTPRRPLTPPPLSAPNRSSKNIAEPAQLRSFRASPLRSLFEAYCRTA